MRLCLAFVVLLTGCADDVRADRVGPPPGSPPRLHQAGPPPAWIETTTRSAWLAYGSYCWKTLCVDMIPPAMRMDIPKIAVERGGSVRVHLAFVARTASVVVLRGDRPTTTRLRAQRVLVWRPRVRGLMLIDVRGTRGSAGYLVRLQFRRG